MQVMFSLHFFFFTIKRREWTKLSQCGRKKTTLGIVIGM